MAKRKKRLKKEIKGLEKQRQKHLAKLKGEEGRKDTTPTYWRKEVEIFSEEIEKRRKKLEKKRKPSRKV